MTTRFQPPREPQPAVGRFPGKPFSFVVMNRVAAEQIALDEPHILISICSPRGKRAEHPESGTRRARLYVDFDDVGYELLTVPDNDFWPEDEQPEFFDETHALRIRDFVAEHREDAAHIVCHCEAGMSRSPAVAIALSRWLNGNDTVADAISRWVTVDRLGLDEDVIFWNRLVHDRLLAVLHN